MEDKTDAFCSDIFRLLFDAIRQQLKPALVELFNAHPTHNFKSIDLQKIVSSIIPPENDESTDFVFEYDKHFVNKVNDNKKSVLKLNNMAQEFTTKLNEISSKQKKKS